MCWANKLLSAERPSFPNSIGLWLLVHGSPSKSVRVRKAMSLLQARIALVSNGGIAIVDFVPPGLKSWLAAGHYQRALLLLVTSQSTSARDFTLTWDGDVCGHVILLCLFEVWDLRWRWELPEMINIDLTAMGRSHFPVPDSLSPEDRAFSKWGGPYWTCKSWDLLR